jgi:predicted transcriptional regulator
MAALETILRARALAVQGHTQRQIAQVMNLSQASVSRYIKASLNPELDEIVKTTQSEHPEIDDDALIGEVVSKVNAKQTAVEETLSEDVKSQRALMLERLDGLDMVLDGLIKGGKPDIVLNAITRALHVHDRRAKVLGIDSPFKYEGSTSTSIVVNGVDMDKLR